MRALAEGRDALQNNRPAAAIAQLKMALLDPEVMPKASNALGVAYAQLGREDIAEGYFKAAIAADPRDTRFADNLLRLQTNLLAKKAKADAARLASQSTSGTGDGGTLVVAAGQSSLQERGGSRRAGMAQRISRSEVFISSAGGTSTPTATVAYATPPKAVQVAQAKGNGGAVSPPLEVRGFPSPIRVKLADVPITEPSTIRRPLSDVPVANASRSAEPAKESP
jgi:hypothetical protein